MAPEQERWAEAATIQTMFGDRAGAYIAERIATLGAAGDRAGVERFEAIRIRWETLHDAPRV